HADGFRPAALTLVRKIVRPAHVALRRLPRREVHDHFLDAGNGLAASEHDAILARLRELGALLRGRQLHRHHVARGRLVVDWRPRRALFANLLDLLPHLLVIHRWHGTRDAESFRAG